ncbi:unnamed protein product [Linum tenue]|uniref:Arf-GAP domain-containing protein n=1 Tax=Linum tenue TaxID=586396 RepID=A0AAV0LFM1_9ROSI|nr:unnamed protein product [Linum tenue]
MMGSRREEERNEKIIRGLLKLPPNRRCINCNSLGPQYVCTNFLTFVCMTCSGIHREFTHRVKSVSMSKFTSQEVEALQNGGNQRAKEIYLADWDQERQRLPASSNIDRVREFIKHVYVDKKYAGTKTADKPPRDLQRIGSYEDEGRRANSYHSFSQSPPYDFQYEDRRYGKHGAALTRRPGSDRGINAGNMSNFVFSPTRSSGRMSDDGFANEGSVSRLSDYSVSSGADLGRSGIGSPNFQKESGGNSPSSLPTGNSLRDGIPFQTVNLFPEVDLKKDANQMTQPQRSMSLGSIPSDTSTTSVKSEPQQVAVLYKENGFAPIPPSSATHDSLGSIKPPTASLPDYSRTASVDLFQLVSSTGSPVDLFSVPHLQSASKSLHQYHQTSPAATLDLFSGFNDNQPVSTLDAISSELPLPKNEGWATFDNIQPAASAQGNENHPPSLMTNSVDLAAARFDQVPSLSTQMEPQAFQNVGAEKPSSLLDPWHDDLHNAELQNNSTSQTWNVFDNSTASFPIEHMQQFSEVNLPAYNALVDLNLHLGQPDKDGTDGDTYFQPHAPNSSSHPVYTVMDQTISQITHSRSSNPFELPYDTDLVPDNMFLDMTSLQSALPNGNISPAFLVDPSQSWFPQDPVMSHIPSAAPQGALSYIPGQTPSPQLVTVPAQGSVASVGGNPFA